MSVLMFALSTSSPADRSGVQVPSTSDNISNDEGSKCLCFLLWNINYGEDGEESLAA